MDLVDRTLKIWRQTPLEYGQGDCVMSVGDYAVEAGAQPAVDQFRGTYGDREGAEALLTQWGGHEGLLGLLGLPAIDPDQARRGDIVVIDTRDGESIAGICTGQGVALRAERGVFELSMRLIRVTHAWRV